MSRLLLMYIKSKNFNHQLLIKTFTLLIFELKGSAIGVVQHKKSAKNEVISKTNRNKQMKKNPPTMTYVQCNTQTPWIYSEIY